MKFNILNSEISLLSRMLTIYLVILLTQLVFLSFQLVPVILIINKGIKQTYEAADTTPVKKYDAKLINRSLLMLIRYFSFRFSAKL